MSTLAATADEAEVLYVVHPLDDVPEQKRTPDGLEHMEMTPAVKISLYTLRGYLIVIVGLALYHIADLFIKGVHHVH